MLDLLEEFRGILAVLESAGVEFAVCGGLAVAIHVRPRATVDVDLLVPDPEIGRAKAALRELGYSIDAGRMILRRGVVEIHRLSKSDPESGDILSVGLIEVTEAMQEAWNTRERVAWAHGRLPVVSHRGLIAMKRLRGSGQDLDDIAALEALDAES